MKCFCYSIHSFIYSLCRVLPLNWSVGAVGIHAATVEDALIMSEYCIQYSYFFEEMAFQSCKNLNEKLNEFLLLHKLFRYTVIHGLVPSDNVLSMPVYWLFTDNNEFFLVHENNLSSTILHKLYLMFVSCYGSLQPTYHSSKEYQSVRV